MSLSLDVVSVRFGRTRAVEGVSYQFPERGVVAVVGPNGSGKSTLLDVMGGFLKANNGEIREGTGRARLQRHGLLGRCVRLHQTVVLPEALTLAQFVAIAARGGNRTWIWSGAVPVQAVYAQVLEARPELRELLAHAALPSDGLLSRLSWGQRRLAALAAVLAVPKPVVLLDEPFAGLTDRARRGLVAVLNAEARTRLVVLAEHDLVSVEKVATCVLVLRDGRLVATLPEGASRADILKSWWEAPRG